MSILSFLTDNYYNNKSASALNQATQQGIDTIGKYYGEGKDYLQPYWNTGVQANDQTGKLLGGDYSGFYNSPDFQARLKAGTDMFDSSAAARGGVFGGGATRGREAYAQGLAQQGLGDYRNWLQGVSSAGQNAGSNIGTLGAAAGQSIAGLQGDMGQNNAQKYQSRAGGINSLFGDIAGSLFGFL